MSNLKTRLGKLELSMISEAKPLRIARFIVDVGFEPNGYTCDGVEIIRDPDESIEALKKRCGNSMVWQDGNYHHIFYPLIAVKPMLQSNNLRQEFKKQNL